ncbi:MAG TPA: 3-methyl-2-oxobutanoate hydroxymethyltransferase [Chloroflexota bacterium]|nr:3-methyl-2-oxobutanoate hydroxymethyltransferase [Chloroflexota bacterium]
MPNKRVSIEKLQGMKRRSEKIVMLTTYDYPAARIAEEAGVDIAFVGDSLAMLVLGHSSTVPVTLDEMLVFMKAVSRGASAPLLLGDLPFGSYLQPSTAIESSGRIIKEGGMDAVKLEGGKDVAAVVRAIVGAGVPVMGHIGLTPQTSGAHGGFKVQGRRADQARRLVEDALALEEAGVFGVVLETIPVEVAASITERLTVPTIGIGSGIGCDGQVLVWHDMLGISGAYGRHVKQYATLAATMLEAVRAYGEDVRAKRFPDEDQTWHMAEEELELFAAVS